MRRWACSTITVFLLGRGISWQAFVDYVCSYTQLRDVESEYRDAFRIYDVSGTGMLSRDDIKYVMGKLGIKCDLDELMNAVDTNRDGTIEYDGMLIYLTANGILFADWLKPCHVGNV